jgi:hypothetical protein
MLPEPVAAQPVIGPISTFEVVESGTERPLYLWREWSEAAPDDPAHVVAVTALRFANGGELREEAVFAGGATPRCVAWERTTRDAAGAVVASDRGHCSGDAFPLVGRPLPAVTYPAHISLPYLVTHLDLGRRPRFEFHVVSLARALVPMELWADGRERVVVPAGTFECHRVYMRPRIEALFPLLGGLLKPVLSRLVDVDSIWITVGEPTLLVKYTGDLGPPGSMPVVLRLVGMEEAPRAASDTKGRASAPRAGVAARE